MRLPRPRRAEASDWRAGTALGVAWGGLLLALLGLTVRTEIVLIPGLGFLLLGVLALTWVGLSSRRVSVARGPVPRRVTEGDPFDTTITVRGGALALSQASVHEPLNGRDISVPARPDEHRADRERSLVVVAHASRRGMHAVPPPTLVISDPLGLVSRRITGSVAPRDLLVLPRLEPVVWASGGRERFGGRERASREPTGAGEVDGLREYRSGTPATRIHWPSLARGAGLLERRLIAAAEQMPVIVLDPRCEDSPGGIEDLDRAVRAAGSLARDIGRRGGCTVLLPGTRTPLTIRPDLRALPELQTRLALVEPEHDPRRRPLLRPDQANGAVVYVSASSASDFAVPGGTPAGSVRVSPYEGDEPPAEAAFAVAGCAGRMLDARAVRRVA